MTTIATDGKTMAGDMLSTCNGQLLGIRPKVHRLKDGRIAGASGPSTECQKLIRWLNEGGDKPELSDEVSAIILNLDGSVDWIDNKLEMLSGNVVPYAIGVGGELAIGAMLAGCTPEEAVKLAATRQLDCTGEITVLHIEPAVRAVA